MVIYLSDIASMSVVNDCEVMHDVIVAETSTGLWYCKKLQPRDMDMDSVPFYEAKEWMTKRWAQICGTGKSHENDQLRDIELKRMIREQQEEMHATPVDTYGCDFDDLMPGASSNEYKDIRFAL